MPSPRRLPAVLALAGCAAALLGALAAPAALAQTRTLGGGKPGGPLMSRNELRECLAGQDRLKARRQETAKLQEELARDKDEITRQGEALKAQLAALDRSSQEQVDRYNAQASERDRLIDTYEARSDAFNAQAEALNAQGEAWRKACENRRYDENDELLIRAGK